MAACARTDLEVSPFEISGGFQDNDFFGPHPTAGTDSERTAFDPDKASIRLDENVYWLQAG